MSAIERSRLAVEVEAIDDRSHNPGEWIVVLKLDGEQIFASRPFSTPGSAEGHAHGLREKLGLNRKWTVTAHARGGEKLNHTLEAEGHASALLKASVLWAGVDIERIDIVEVHGAHQVGRPQ